MPKIQEKSHASEQQGVVISLYGSTVSVETTDGKVIPCYLRRSQEAPVVGDVVIWQPESGEERGVVVRLLPRRSLLARGDMRGSALSMKPLAANIDVLVVVVTSQQGFSTVLLDRYLVAAEILKIPPMLVINKVDLLSTDEMTSIESQLAVYRHIPYPVVLTSVASGSGLKELGAALSGRRGVLVGPSGVGKSSLIAALGAMDDVRVGAVSEKGAGKHTTTASRLYHLKDGGELIDSPGVRDFTLWPVSPAEILMGFREFQPYLTGCRFRDCTHAVEPGCSVQQAVKDGKISLVRYQSYQTLLKNN